MSSRSLAAAGPQNWTFGLGQYTRSGGEEAAAGGARRQAVGPERRPRRVGFAFLALSRLGAGCAHWALGSASHWLAARRPTAGLLELGGGELLLIGEMEVWGGA